MGQMVVCIFGDALVGQAHADIDPIRSDHPHFALDTKEVADRVRMLNKPLLYVGFEDDSTLNK